jgi:hypothetical protein
MPSTLGLGHRLSCALDHSQRMADVQRRADCDCGYD